MRITNNMLINNMIKYIGNNLTRMDKLQAQLATGKKIQVPSDDPVVAARALKLRTDVAEIQQYQRNLKDAQSWLEITESALSDMGDIFQRVRELIVGSDAIESPEDLQATKNEIIQLRTQLINLGNSAYAGRYIFTGFKTDQKLLDEAGNFLVDVSNSEQIFYQIGLADSVNINVLGGDLFNSGTDITAGSTGKFIQDMNELIQAFDDADYEAIRSMTQNFSDNLDNVLRLRADVGARINRLELTANRMMNDNTNFTRLMSENENVDMTDTIMNLKNEENVYRASLAGGARIIMPSLIDFLR
ncbi:MAG: flagellar hook-associated protein FlgL [Clostridiaceae bacterium]|jgi:flagellar hook-associated protein 3 FlgL|nr:flagellar hook-associated protein FlgL [Bacillota bacterium]NLP07111.1 flagellar hook-associated protein FlgL [Clostridiaceae bacterium]